MAGRTKQSQGLLVEADFSRGIITDLPRTALPQGTVSDSTDYLLHRPGIAEKRGGTAYFGPEIAATVPNFLDSSGEVHEITQNGNATIDTSVFDLGDGSVKFSGGYLTLDETDDNDDFIFGTSDFTIDFLLQLNSIPPHYARLYDSRPEGSASIVPTNKLQEAFFTGSTYTTSAKLNPSQNTLYLLTVAIPHDLTVSSVTGCGLTWTQITSKAQTSGGHTVYVTVYRAMESTGLIEDNVVVTLSGEVSDKTHVIIDEFSGVNTSGTHGSGAIVQSATAGSNTADRVEVSLSTFASPSNFGFGAFAHATSNAPTPDSGYTALAAVRGSGGSGHSVLTEYKAGDTDPKVQKVGGDLTAGIGIEVASGHYPVIYLSSDGKVNFSSSQGTSVSADITSTTALSPSSWYHIAVVRSSGTTSLYIAGLSEASFADSNTYTNGGTGRPMWGGSGVSPGDETLDGWIDEARVSNSARWVANFTPSTSAYASDANTMFLMHGDNYLLASTSLRMVTYSDFPTGGLVLATADDAHLYIVTSDTYTDLGSIATQRTSPLCKPVFHVSGTCHTILPANDGVTVPYMYDGTTLTALSGSPPAGRIAATYKARLLLASSLDNPNRLWFSPLDITTTWDTANAWVDFDDPVTGLATVRNTLLVFSAGRVDYVTGSVPPGTQGFDMAQGTLGQIGCADARSIDVWQDNVIVANQNGVYMTQGAAFRCLTEPQEFGNSGIGDHWRSLLVDHTSSWQINGGVIGDFYIVTIRDSTDTLVETWVCYLPRRTWMRLDNFDAGMYAARLGGTPELFYASRDVPRVTQVSGIFSPIADNKNDADGNPVEPTLTTRFLGTGPLLKAYGFARLTYDLRDAGDVPEMSVSLATGAEATTFVDVAESPLAATDDATRARVSLNKDAQGVTLKFSQTGPSSKTEIFALEVEERQYDKVIDGES